MDIGGTVDLYEHSVQSATRALRDGAGEEKAICALMHDVGEVIAPACHGEVGNNKEYLFAFRYLIISKPSFKLALC